MIVPTIFNTYQLVYWKLVYKLSINIYVDTHKCIEEVPSHGRITHTHLQIKVVGELNLHILYYRQPLLVTCVIIY